MRSGSHVCYVTIIQLLVETSEALVADVMNIGHHTYTQHEVALADPRVWSGFASFRRQLTAFVRIYRRMKIVLKDCEKSSECLSDPEKAPENESYFW